MANPYDSASLTRLISWESFHDIVPPGMKPVSPLFFEGSFEYVTAPFEAVCI